MVPWGRTLILRKIGRDAPVASAQSFSYSPAGDLLAVHTYTNGTGAITETYAYDLLGNRIATTDALGNTVFRSYDPFGNLTAEWGATYPVRCTYDTAGRRTSLTTFRTTAGRDAPIAPQGDTTPWTYDPSTGNCLSKTYADGSAVAYTCTPDNLPLRTTCASGRWKENVYDGRRQVVAVEYSDGETDSFAYDAFANEIAASNGVVSAWLDRDAKGNCTNETATTGNESKTIIRTYDAFSRLTGIDGTIYDYNADGLLASISNAIAVVNYAYTPDLLDAGYSLTLSNGVVFTRSLSRDGYRRSLVTGISSVANGVGAGSLEYAYDALNRPTSRNGDTFGYNERSEVTAAYIGGHSEMHEYDNIGNSILATFNGTTNTYTANNLNQCTYIQVTSAPSAGEIIPAYDADGNMTQCGDWTCAYDAENRLIAAYPISPVAGSLAVVNRYGHRHRRVRKIVNVMVAAQGKRGHTLFCDIILP